MTMGQQAHAEHLENDLLLASGDGDQFLTFILAGEEYGIDILRVEEIRGWSKTTPIPNAPSYLKGVINLRGTIVPIVDLRERFHLEHLDYGPTTVVIVVRVQTERQGRVMGIVVDAVSDVYKFKSIECQAPPEMGSNVDARFVQGLATVDDKMVILLDIDRLLNMEALTEILSSNA
ncbi:chemotaxis protein CheW [Thiorhodospira sibirica]|uniref:chemotaxis protein CheW n=1 Tax=Thiorhodospira sibirica TaxID=154347 RepID=UPI00022C1142|nr:chemotaxis protein CheW [Thiorhodospira sibirica]